MFVICKNDFPLAVCNLSEDEIIEIVNKIQNKSDEKTKKEDEQRGWKYHTKRIFIHYHEVSELFNLKDIKNLNL